jgi:hypothetical protein
VLIERLECLVPAIKGMPDKAKQHERWIRGALEHTLPIHGLPRKAYPLVKVFGRGDR